MFCPLYTRPWGRFIRPSNCNIFSGFLILVAPIYFCAFNPFRSGVPVLLLYLEGPAPCSLGSPYLRQPPPIPAPTFASPINMSLEVGQLAAAMTQVKLCPYDEEEPAIWFRRIDAQYATAGINLQKLKYADALANLPKQVLRDILNG